VDSGDLVEGMEGLVLVDLEDAQRLVVGGRIDVVGRYNILISASF